MNLMESILAHIAYIDTVNAIKEREPDCEPPSLDEILNNAEVRELVAECTNQVREYLHDKYEK